MTQRPNPAVKIWEIHDRWTDKNDRAKPKLRWQVRWKVNARSFSDTFATKAYARNLWHKLHDALKAGESFDPVSGRPESFHSANLSFPSFAREYISFEWDTWAPNSRRSNVEGLVRAIPLFVHPSATCAPEGIRHYLDYHFLRPNPFGDDEPDAACAKWLDKWALPLESINQLVADRVHTALGHGDNGSPLAANTAKRYRRSVSACFARAVDKNLIATNPWPKPKLGRRKQKAKEMTPATTVVPTVLPNQDQARDLLMAVVNFKRRSRIHYAFLGTIYACGLRPFEVAGLAPWDIDLPATGFGWFQVRGGKPGGIPARWYDSDEDVRTGPKGQAFNDAGRSVPIPPWWAAELRHVLDQCPSRNDILFSTENGTSPTPTNINRAWVRAKAQVLKATVPVRLGSKVMIPNPLLTTTPYDLRHTRASLWLQDRAIPIPQVAEWMGHSPDVLMRIYANCISGDMTAALAAIEASAIVWHGWSEESAQPARNREAEVGSNAMQDVA